MRFIGLILLLSLSVLAFTSLGASPTTNSTANVITDYPRALQKAGVKKVRCIFKDSRGFIWIGTENGLYRYDGTSVDVLQHDASNPHSLPHNTVVSLTEDHGGNIWAGTLEGAAQINPWSFVCRIFNRRAHNLDQDFDVKIYVDRQGKTWAYGSRGLDLFDNRTGRFSKVWNHRSKHKSGLEYINNVTEWKKDTLIFGTFDGAVAMSTRNFGYRLILGDNDVTVTRVFTDENKKLWLGTWGHGCYVSDSLGRQFTILKPEAEAAGELPNVVTGIISTNYNRGKVLWMSTLRGVYKITGYTGSTLSLKTISKTLIWPGYSGNLMADDEQYVWEAGATVSRFFAGSSFFSPVPFDYKGSVEDIKPLIVNKHKAAAVMSWYSNSGLLIASLQGETIYKQPPQNDQDHANVADIAQDKYERLWVSSLSGVEVFDANFKPVYESKKITAPKDRLLSYKTNAVLIAYDTVWVACYKKGIDLYDLNFHKLRYFLPGDGSGLTDDYIQRIFADSRGGVWLFGNNKLFKYESSRKKFKSFNFNKDGTSFGVNSMAELPTGDLLIATTSGLYRFDEKKGIYSRITSPLIDDNNIEAVSVDARGNIWFINAEHLIWYQVKTKHFSLFGHEDGLNTSGDLQWLRVIDKKYFYLAAGRQIVTFSPGSGAYASRPVSLYFHDVEVNDSTLAKGTFADSLQLKYNENRLNIGFGAINYIKPEQNLYAYQLTGVDNKWIYTSRNFASYANLAPGSYTLKLKAANYAGIWGDPISMSIFVTPPYWGTWWFRTLSFILVSSVLFIAVRYVLQRNLRERILKLEKEQAVEKERNRIARDMHDDLGSGLTKIAILSEVTKAQMSSPVHASANLDIISHASRELVDNLQDIIWVLNPKNDSLGSLILYIKEYAEGFFEPAGLQYEFACDQMNRKLTLSEEQRRNIFLAVKESCNNILKHARSTKACINIKLNHSRLVITIKDNGRGFDIKEIGNFSNGLQNIRNRMEQIGAACSIDSAKTQGTVVALSIPV